MDHALISGTHNLEGFAGPPNSSGRGWATRASAILKLAIEVPTALILLVEIVVLFAGILARHVFQSPLVWTDELASILFL